MTEQCRELVDLYSLELLQGVEREAFEAHLQVCNSCRATVEANRTVLALASAGSNVAEPSRFAREWLLDFAKAPRGPVDLASRQWEEVAPGVRLHVFGDDTPRSVRSELMWGAPGAVRPTHRHLGEEAILVLEGGVVVADRDYGIGEVCRVRAGEPHSELMASSEECVCFLVHRPAIQSPTVFGGAPESRCVSCVFYPEHRAAFDLAAHAPRT